jgi:hypothetical protein
VDFYGGSYYFVGEGGGHIDKWENKGRILTAEALRARRTWEL